MSYTPPDQPPPPPPPPSGPGGGGMGPGGYGYTPPQTNQKALWAMILGILGLVLCGIFAGIPALILGNQAKKEIAMAGGMQTGAGMAKAGVILGWISVAFTVVALLFLTTGTLTGTDV